MPYYELYGNLKFLKLSQAVTILAVLACSGEMQASNLNPHIIYFDPAVLCFYFRPLGQTRKSISNLQIQVSPLDGSTI